MHTDLDHAIATSAATLHQRLGPPPAMAVLLGSGWHPFADALQDAVALPYAELPAFPALAVGGHSGTLRVGQVGAARVAVLGGRKHAYETGEADAMKGCIRALAAWGVKLLLQTNAAGSLDPAMPPGSLMLLADHINLSQRSPLFGQAGDGRFVDMGNAYDAALRAQARAAAQGAGVALFEGVYAWHMGPQFETPAEIRMFRLLGAQAVGMSTVPETILARHAGMKVLALSLITNMAAGMTDEQLSHAHTLATAAAASERAVALLKATVQALEIPA
jgi:purine-nucleoside phosphorylase